MIPYNPHRAYAESCIGRETAGKIHRELKEYLANNYREHYAEKIENGVAFEIVTKSGREDDEIIKFAKQEKTDLIVMGSHRRAGIQHVLFGSVAEKVLRNSPVPVFVIPDRKKLER